MNKKQIFEENEQDSQPSNKNFRINKQFAERFEKTKQRQLLDQKRNQIYSDESSSNYSSEDSNGELITDQVAEKFLTTLAKIHQNDPTLNEGNVFSDSDFENQNQQQRKEKKGITYKDMVRESLLEKGDQEGSGYDSDEYQEQQQQQKGLAPIQVEQNLKNDFIKAIKTQQVNDNQQEQQQLADDDFLKVKKKGKKEQYQEQLSYEKFLKKKPLKKFWKVDEKLDENEKFLRNFILSKGWIDKTNGNQEEEDNQLKELRSQEDEEFEERNDMYEEEWNFRFEEPGANQLITYERKHDGPLHEKQASKRKQQRERQKEAKLQQKEQMKKEIEIVKNAKQQEIQERLQKLDNVSGGIGIESDKLEELLKADYNPEDFDKHMKEMFSEQAYFQQQEQNVEELKNYIKKARGENPNSSNEPNQNPDTKLITQDKSNADQVKTSLPVGLKKTLKPEEITQLQSSQFHIWYYCDNCQKGLPEYSMKFDCLECDDYCLCKKCKELFPHQHKMRKSFVPKGCAPPNDEEILLILQGIRICTKCSIKIMDSEDYFQLKEGEGKFCANCYNKIKFSERKEMVQVKGKIDPNDLDEKNIDKVQELVNDEKINQLVEDYYALDFEDIIADGLKTKYKYIKVKPEDYGLTDDAIQYCDEKLLNSFVSVKKIAPYRQDEGMVYEKLLKRKRPYVEKNAMQNEKKFRKNLKQLSKVKQQLKELKKQQKKSNKQKIFNEIMELEKKEKQLEIILTNGKEQLDSINIENAAKQNNTDNEYQQKQITKNVSQSRLKSYGIEQ